MLLFGNTTFRYILREEKNNLVAQNTFLRNIYAISEKVNHKVICQSSASTGKTP
ncbi:hypothetical protein NIES4073_57180 [Kalymmatonema gypsitolerans NIES-4073]|nr:hypothetical protein NIES4073_57180 [Scytonema sp. NIES-4073]